MFWMHASSLSQEGVVIRAVIRPGVLELPPIST